MAQTMMALVKEKREAGATLKRVPVPSCGADEVLVRVMASSICGTDRHIYEWDAWAEQTVATPNVFGHEFAGVVVEVGERVTAVKPGDHVSGEGHIACGTCKACRTGLAHVCPHTRSFGITAPGCFAEYAILRKENVIANAADMPFEVACLQDPFGNAVQTVLAGDIAGKSVAVVGAGAIGLMAIAAAKACGAGTIIAVDVNAYKLKLASAMGADHALDSSLPGDVAARIRELTGGEGAEVVLEMSGHPAGIRDAFEAAAQGARVSLLGIPTKPVPLDLARHIIFKGLRIDGITGRRMFDTWYRMKGLLDNGRVDLRPLVTHRFPLDRYREAFELVRSGECAKVVFIH